MIFAGLACGLLMTPAVATPQQTVPQPDQEPAQYVQPSLPFDGMWEGIIHFDKEAFLTPTGTPDKGLKYRLEISGLVVRVFIEEDSKFVEVKPGLFHIAPVETNAVFFASEAAPDSWVESVVFTATQRDAKTLIVQLVRVVNNRSLPLDDKQSKFAARGAGDFSKVAP